MYPSNFKYTKSHEWIEINDDEGKVGITDHAQSHLGDIVYVERPEVGDSVEAGEPFGTIESVKAVEDVYAPMSGKVVAVNDKLEDEPELINEDPHGEGWIIKIKLSDMDESEELMNVDKYEEFAAEDEED